MWRKTNSDCKNKLLVPQRSCEIIKFARHLEGKRHSSNNRNACLNHKLQLHTLNATGLNCEQNNWPGASIGFSRLRPFTEFNASLLFLWMFLGQAPSLKINSHVCTYDRLSDQQNLVCRAGPAGAEHLTQLRAVVQLSCNPKDPTGLIHISFLWSPNDI